MFYPKVMEIVTIPTLLVLVLTAALILWKELDFGTVSVANKVPEGPGNLPQRHEKVFSSGRRQALVRHLAGKGITAPRYDRKAGEAPLSVLSMHAALF